ncbi:MAG TPA: hypothetical protein VFV86_01405 [Nitrososphaeraceae archaeon]|nr:hypothetical protein [Nitrososphaeraceae archaeon]
MLDTRYPENRNTREEHRYIRYGIDAPQDKSRKPYNIQPGKVTKEIEQQILDLRTTKGFGCNRIRFRLKRLEEISLSTKTIFNILKRHGLNILQCKIKKRKWKKFAMKEQNKMV